MTELYINQQLADLPDEQQPVLNFEVLDISKPARRESNWSYTFTLPYTTTNRSIFEGAEQVHAHTDTPYQKLPATLRVDGVEIVSNGFVTLQQSGEGYQVVIYSGNRPFFDTLGDKRLSDLDLSDLEHQRDFADIDASYTHTGGYIYPYFQHGGLKPVTLPTGQEAEVAYIDRLVPSVFVHTLLSRIFQEAGYPLQSSMLQEAFFRKLIMPCTQLKGLRTAEQYKLEATIQANGRTVTFPGSGNYATIPFDTVVHDPPGWLQQTGPGTGEWHPQKTVAAKAEVVVRIRNINYHNTPGSFNWYLRLEEVGAANPIAQIEVHSSTVNAAIGLYGFADLKFDTEEILFRAGKAYRIAIHDGQDEVDTLEVLPESVFRIIPTGHAVYESTITNPAELLPQMTQKDFLLSLMRMFTLVMQQDEYANTVLLEPFDRLANNLHNGIDWSDKLSLEPRPESSYRLGGYAQQNQLYYREDEAVDEAIGAGTLTVDDASLNPAQELFHLQFAASPMERYYGVDDLAMVPLYRVEDGEWIEQDDLPPKILALKYEEIELPVTESYLDPPDPLPLTRNFPFATFAGLGFEELIPRYYKGLQRVLHHTRVVTAAFRLTAHDIHSLDHFKPVYIDALGHWFYIQKIEYNGSDLSTVTLVRI